MDISLPSLLLGVAGVGVAYFGYLVATKGMKAALAWLKSEWAAGAGAVAKVKADLAQLESGVVSTVKSDVAALAARVSALEAKTSPATPANQPTNPQP
ncbi:hypothetical protein [Bradyrhizobium ivorense]|uniref:hypothetical protein n=1 Tax=Bradyrhizobium ivorense TaxID=2511166 RepID=UPI0010BB1165|nr:hypothetical protein [Bradyrhizobium ivorense]VIO73907.1 hypothetical protein CI41S_40160 [Bradyrhizobium ivorense]